MTDIIFYTLLHNINKWKIERNFICLKYEGVDKYEIDIKNFKKLC